MELYPSFLNFRFSHLQFYNFHINNKFQTNVVTFKHKILNLLVTGTIKILKDNQNKILRMKSNLTEKF